MAKSTEPDTANTNEPLLRLSTLTTIRPLVVDDERYEFVNLDALPIRKRMEIAELLVPIGQQLSALYDRKAKPPTKAKERQIARDVDKIVRLLVPKLPDRVLDKLTGPQRQEIVFSFLLERMRNTDGAILREVAQMTAEQNSGKSTGASTSRASNGSTAAPRKRGTTASRRRSSGRS